jgi:hypothetical protein
MSEPNQEAREAPPSIAPVQIERAAEEQDLASMRGRRGPRIVVTVVALAAATFGVVRLLKSMDAHQAYSEAAAQLERSEVEQREAFMRCALPHQQNTQLASQSALQGAIEIATERMGKTYASVLTKCTPLLDSFKQSVAAIQSPADTAGSVKAVSKTANEFAVAWLGLRDFLRSSGEYDRTQIAPHIQAITSAWEAYSTERIKAKAALAARF